MDDRSEPILRLKGCLRCDGLFGLCRSCDRGQRYCGEACRRQARLEQHRRANRRHQSSVEGRLDHRDRQRAYRARLRARVTDPRRRPATIRASLLATAGSTPVWGLDPSRRQHAHPFVAVCRRCGRFSRRVDPFHWG